MFTSGDYDRHHGKKGKPQQGKSRRVTQFERQKQGHTDYHNHYILCIKYTLILMDLKSGEEEEKLNCRTMNSKSILIAIAMVMV